MSQRAPDSDRVTVPFDELERETLTSIEPATVSRTPESGQRPLLIVMSGNDTGRIHSLDDSEPETVIGREDGVDLQLLDAEISRRHAALRFEPASGTFFIRDLGSRNGTAVNGERIRDERPVRVGDKIRLGLSTVLRLSLSGEPEAHYARQMFQVALRDGLTGAYNRRYLDERLVAEVAFARRHRSPLSLLLIDIDHFKNINDAHGHQAGDAVLKGFIELLESEIRTEDVVARYGGEEFIVLCRESLSEGAAVLAERVRSRVERACFVHDGVIIPVTVSIGIAGVVNGIADAEGLLKAADQALYLAKTEGRNCWRRAVSA